MQPALSSSMRFMIEACRGLGELGRMAIYFQGAGEQADYFGDLGSTAKKAEEINFKNLGRSGPKITMLLKVKDDLS